MKSIILLAMLVIGIAACETPAPATGSSETTTPSSTTTTDTTTATKAPTTDTSTAKKDSLPK